MQGIYIAALITSVLSLVVIGVPLFLRAPKEQRWTLGVLVLVMLPMNALAFYCVRMPLDGWLSSTIGRQNEAYFFIQTFYAPITEEPAKLWPLLIPFFYSRIRFIPVHRVALAIGLGFGVGEAWTVAGLLSKSPEIAKYPWYLLGGYISERMMVCVMHGAFTAIALLFIFKHQRVILGVVACMLLHFIGNFPIFLARLNAFDLSAEMWQVILQLWVPAYFIIMGCLLAYIAYGTQWFEKMVRGNVLCPECDQVYKHPLFGVNLLHKRYERCPHCKHWHLVSAFDQECITANKAVDSTATRVTPPASSLRSGQE